MGKIKNDMRKIHSRNVKKAKEELQLYCKNELSYDKLNHLAKGLLARQRKKQKKKS